MQLQHRLSCFTNDRCTYFTRNTVSVRVIATAAAPKSSDGQQFRRKPRPSTKRSPQADTLNLKPVADAADDGKQEWLAKALASAGVASRRNCIDLVKQGQVRVNGTVITDPATRVDPAADVLEVAGKGRLQLAAPGGPELHYFALNKPPGYICSNVSHNAPGKRAADLLQPWLDDWQRQHRGQLPPRLFTVGRLDVATSGLIFLTNDGDWANKVIHPSANILKEYRVTLPQQPTQQQLRLLKAGTTIEGVHVVPKRVQLLQPPSVAAGSAHQGPARGSSSSSSSSSSSGNAGVRRSADGRCVLCIEVSEGKKHEVRLLVAAAGLQLLALSRVRVGGWVMPRSLKQGAYMRLQPKELEKIFQQYK